MGSLVGPLSILVGAARASRKHEPAAHRANSQEGVNVVSFRSVGEMDLFFPRYNTSLLVDSS